MYVQPTELLEATIEAKKLGECTPRLAGHFLAISEGLSWHRWFRGWSFREDLSAIGATHLAMCWHNVKIEEVTDGKQLFAYYTKCAQSAFMKYIDKERMQHEIVDETLLDLGMEPTNGYQDRQLSGSRWAARRNEYRQLVLADREKAKNTEPKTEKVPGGGWRPARPAAFVFELTNEHTNLTEKQIIFLAHNECNLQNIIPHKIIYKSGEHTLLSTPFDEKLRVKKSEAMYAVDVF